MREPLDSSRERTARLRCVTCRNWELTTLRALPDGEAIGQCLRFSEARRGSARPRCNICWEPAVVALYVVEPPGGAARASGDDPEA